METIVKNENVKNKELIAQFMGYEFLNMDGYCDLYPSNLEIESLPILEYMFECWDELMPIVEKCLEIHNSSIDGRDIIETPYTNIVDGLMNVSIRETYIGIIQFIKWYKKQTK